MTTSETTVTSINCYPVKSCKGIQLQQALVGATGVIFDRYWMLVDRRGKFITQRKYPQLAQVCTSIATEILSGEWGQIPEDATLTISASNHPILNVPLITQQETNKRLCQCWEWKGYAIDEGDEAAEWFTNFLGGVETRLVRYAGDISTDFKRPTDPEFAPTHEVQFPDGFPILLTSTGSLDDYNKKASQNLPMNRFRPNIVVENQLGFQEDDWAQAETDQGIKFQFVKPCSRCSVTTVNQTEGQFQGKEPLKSMRSFRSGQSLGWSDNMEFKSWKNEIFFGWNLVVLNTGILRVGDTLKIQHRVKKFAS